MNHHREHTERIRFFGRWQNLAFAFILCIPLWIFADIYTHQWNVPEDDSMATALVIIFCLAMFAGRYLAFSWIEKAHRQMQSTILLLTVLIAAPAITLFILLDFPSTALRGLKLFLLFICFIIIGGSAGMLIKFVRSYQDKQVRDAQLSAATSRAELKVLQAQLSPHFLFNTLNNLYGLSITQPAKLPPLLLKLSELLRYSVYGAGELMVPLKDELAYILHYIEFEKIRLDNRLVLETDMEQGRQSTIGIAPLLLIVLVENAFKHARQTTSMELFISIRIRIQAGELVFFVENSCPDAGISARSLNKNSGFGLMNLKDRLNLLYPDKHVLQTSSFNSRFRAELRIKID